MKLSESLRGSVVTTTKKLNLSQRHINEIDRLTGPCKPLAECNILLLGRNELSELSGLEQFTQLKKLSLMYNKVRNFQEIGHVRSGGVVDASLEGNPIARHPNYPILMCLALPSLRTLDSHPVSGYEKELFELMLEVSDLVVGFVLFSEHVSDILYRDANLAAISVELHSVAFGGP
eukprot:Rmarinus@m.3449